ncbi:MAG: hypothetical protein QW569_01785, partial [Candidatus Bathyarchaeia archaeon]
PSISMLYLKIKISGMLPSWGSSFKDDSISLKASSLSALSCTFDWKRVILLNGFMLLPDDE